MSAKRLLSLVIFVLLVAAVVLCVTSCGRSRSDRLWFVGGDGLLPPQPAGRSLVVVTHGWIEKGKGGWPEDMAAAIRERTEPNAWLCGYFDWSEGARTFNATNAAEYARDVAGPRLAEEIIKLGGNFQHIHLIGHSGGCWAVSEAAKILAGKTKADIHLTFLDAYTPAFWEESSLGDIEPAAGKEFWADHYYTRDYTLGWTQQDLSCAHNVDVTSIDRGLKDHNFPWKWYHATISGRYPEGGFLNNRKLVSVAEGVEYGFARSREAACSNGWNRSLKLPVGNEAVKFKRP